jgi:hypothetical protein
MDLSAERFLANPYGVAGTRMLRNLAWWHVDLDAGRNGGCSLDIVGAVR